MSSATYTVYTTDLTAPFTTTLETEFPETTTEDYIVTTTVSTTTTRRVVRMDPCLCDDPPSVSNGAVAYTGSYINNTRAEYSCNSGYSNSGGSSLLCFVYNTTDCSNDWITDPDDLTSGVPSCLAVTPIDYIYNNAYSTMKKVFKDDDDDVLLYVLIALAVMMLLLLLTGLILLMWHFCCRVCCRDCCMRGCERCCRQDDSPHFARSENGVMYYNGHQSKQVRAVRVVPVQSQYNNYTNPSQATPRQEISDKRTEKANENVPAQTQYNNYTNSSQPTPRQEKIPDKRSEEANGNVTKQEKAQKQQPQPVGQQYYGDDSYQNGVFHLSPETFRRHYGYYPQGYTSPSSVDFRSDTSSEVGAQPKEFVKMQNSRMELPQQNGFEPKHFVHMEEDKMKVPQGKPVDSHGQPVWMPHTNSIRAYKTSTK